MHISIEISMYPLHQDYENLIDNFLYELHDVDGLKIRTNVMSTQIFGESKLVFSTLERLISQTYGSLKQCPFVIKVLNDDVSDRNVKDY